MSTQQISSILRQIASILLVVMGILTAALQGIHLPTAVSTVMTAVGGGLMWIEHYVGDTSTGTPTTTTTTSSTVPTSQLAPGQPS